MAAAIRVIASSRPAALDRKASTVRLPASRLCRLINLRHLCLFHARESTFGKTLVTLILGRSATTTHTGAWESLYRRLAERDLGVSSYRDEP
jgi:hypothetical protein